MARTPLHTLQMAVVIGALGYVLFTSMFVSSFSQGLNNRNVSVDTRVNITQSFPEILAIAVEGGATNITLNAGSTKLISCNASVRDYNGGSTLIGNATLFHNLTANSSYIDDNNNHYTNGSCAVTGTNGIYRNFSCSFPLQYYANVGFWTCNFTVTDDYNFTDMEQNRTHIDQLLALNVTTLIDYGNMAVGDTSNPQTANVTNYGNSAINVTVKGYGATFNDGLSFVCDIGNISIEYEKYNRIGGMVLTDYTNLSSAYTQVQNLTIPQQTNDSYQEFNTTYWILYVPPNPFGQCNGTVVFQAELS